MHCFVNCNILKAYLTVDYLLCGSYLEMKSIKVNDSRDDGSITQVNYLVIKNKSKVQLTSNEIIVGFYVTIII